MPRTTKKRSLRSINRLPTKTAKKSKLMEENHDNQPLDITSPNISLTTSVTNANPLSKSDDEDLNLGDVNQPDSNVEAHGESSNCLIYNKSCNGNPKTNDELLIRSTTNETPRVNPVLSLAPPGRLNSSTTKDQWRNQSLETDASFDHHFNGTPIPHRSLNENGVMPKQISTQASNTGYNVNKASAKVLHSSSNLSPTGRREHDKNKSSLVASSSNISSDNNINTNSSISISRRPTVRKIIQNKNAAVMVNSASQSTASNRSPAAMSINTRAVIEGSLEYRELKRAFNAERKLNQEWSRDYALLKKEFEQTKSSSIPRPAAHVVDWLEEILLSVGEGQYQGDGRSKQEVADVLGLDPVSLLTVVGRTAQKTALKIFRRKYPTPRARAAIGSIVAMDEEELHNIYVYSRWVHRKHHYSVSDMRKAIATTIRNSVNYVRKLADEQQVQLQTIACATNLNDQERDQQVQSALDKLQQALDNSIIDEEEEDSCEEEIDFVEY